MRKYYQLFPLEFFSCVQLKKSALCEYEERNLVNQTQLECVCTDMTKFFTEQKKKWGFHFYHSAFSLQQQKQFLGSERFIYIVSGLVADSMSGAGFRQWSFH